MAFVVLDFLRLAFFMIPPVLSSFSLAVLDSCQAPAGYFRFPRNKRPSPLPSMNAELAIGARSQQSEQTNPHPSSGRKDKLMRVTDGVPGALLLLGIHQVETVNGTAAPFREAGSRRHPGPFQSMLDRSVLQ